MGSQRVGHDLAAEQQQDPSLWGQAGQCPNPSFATIFVSLVEKKMATHSSTLAWKSPWMEEPGSLQSMGLQSVGHN